MTENDNENKYMSFKSAKDIKFGYMRVDFTEKLNIVNDNDNDNDNEKINFYDNEDDIINPPIPQKIDCLTGNGNEEFDKLDFHPERFSAIENVNGAAGCYLSHLEILKKARAKKKPMVFTKDSCCSEECYSDWCPF